MRATLSTTPSEGRAMVVLTISSGPREERIRELIAEALQRRNFTQSVNFLIPRVRQVEGLPHVASALEDFVLACRKHQHLSVVAEKPARRTVGPGGEVVHSFVFRFGRQTTPPATPSTPTWAHSGRQDPGSQPE